MQLCSVKKKVQHWNNFTKQKVNEHVLPYKEKLKKKKKKKKKKSLRGGSNSWPLVYETSALPLSYEGHRGKILSKLLLYSVCSSASVLADKAATTGVSERPTLLYPNPPDPSPPYDGPQYLCWSLLPRSAQCKLCNSWSRRASSTAQCPAAMAASSEQSPAP